MYIVTVKLPRSPNHLAALRCKHVKRPDGHCGMTNCPNYVSKCQKHSIYGPDGPCSRDKVTGQCPVGIGQCTDVTGEHHSFLDGKARSIEEAIANTMAIGPNTHITRIEELHPIR